jgi:hypothetical protein
MNKSELNNTIDEQSNLSKPDAGRRLGALIKTIETTLKPAILLPWLVWAVLKSKSEQSVPVVIHKPVRKSLS